jgi:hypothetical protein
MKPLTCAAVFGLLPIPLPPNTHSPGDKDGGARACDEGHEATGLRPEAAERLATAEELARLRREFGLGGENMGAEKAVEDFGSGRRPS